MGSHQHYVSRLHQRPFADSRERVWVYDRRRGEYRTQSVRDTAVRKNYYTVPAANNQPSSAIDDALTGIESEAAPAIARLINHGTGPLRIADDDRVAISIYLAALHGRVPAVREPALAMAKLMGELEFLQGTSPGGAFVAWLESRGSTPEEAEAIREDVWREAMEGGVSVHVQEWMSLIAIQSSLEVVAPRLYERTWRLFKRTTPPWFVLGDAPVMLWPPRGFSPNRVPGFDTPGVEVLIPLAPDALLAITNDDETDELATIDVDLFALQMNYRSWITAEYVIGQSRSDLELTAEFVGPELVDLESTVEDEPSMFEVVRRVNPGARGVDATEILATPKSAWRNRRRAYTKPRVSQRPKG